MAKYAVELSDEFAAEVDLPPGAPALSNLALTFHVSTEDELRATIEACGGLEAFSLNVKSRLQARYGVPLTRDGERVGSCDVHVFLADGLKQPEPVYEVVRALEAERDRRRREGRVGYKGSDEL